MHVGWFRTLSCPWTKNILTTFFKLSLTICFFFIIISLPPHPHTRRSCNFSFRQVNGRTATAVPLHKRAGVNPRIRRSPTGKKKKMTAGLRYLVSVSSSLPSILKAVYYCVWSRGTDGGLLLCVTRDGKYREAVCSCSSACIPLCLAVSGKDICFLN